MGSTGGSGCQGNSERFNKRVGYWVWYRKLEDEAFEIEVWMDTRAYILWGNTDKTSARSISTSRPPYKATTSTADMGFVEVVGDGEGWKGEDEDLHYNVHFVYYEDAGCYGVLLNDVDSRGPRNGVAIYHPGGLGYGSDLHVLDDDTGRLDGLRGRTMGSNRALLPVPAGRQIQAYEATATFEGKQRQQP